MPLFSAIAAIIADAIAACHYFHVSPFHEHIIHYILLSFLR
jgi:hypothetical protein